MEEGQFPGTASQRKIYTELTSSFMFWLLFNILEENVTGFLGSAVKPDSNKVNYSNCI